MSHQYIVFRAMSWDLLQKDLAKNLTMYDVTNESEVVQCNYTMTDSISESPRERQGARVGRHEAQAAVAGARLGGRQLAHPADHAVRALLQLRVAVSTVSMFHRVYTISGEVE